MDTITPDAVLLSGDHPWAGYTADVIERFDGKTHVRARLRNTHVEVFVFHDQWKALDGD